ncbi:unnamed protein product [Blumeria hordei]|uniref:Uncharacterized protein n=1 Tax=Blumeria hordei TaxID=2867405 RepID=A0A383UZE4_BLUHO|nr:unnamed protein product [Blumeria hordei]
MVQLAYPAARRGNCRGFIGSISTKGANRKALDVADGTNNLIQGVSRAHSPAAQPKHHVT